jgi:aminoglycoside phosphotransferase (APT) family kinase protein
VLDLAVVPEQHRDKAAAAITASFGAGGASAIRPVQGGASGALTFAVETGHGDHLLRLEVPSGVLRNPHQYTCMEIAAEAGIAPPIRHVDADAGVVVMPLIATRPLAEHAGGGAALAAEAAALLRRLHDATPFPTLADHLQNLDGLLRHLASSGRVGPGLLDRHRQGFDEVRAAYPWEPSTFVSCHNDPNQFNVLSDGERLWLIDWETASRNDPMIDLATMATHAAADPEARVVLLRTWLGRDPDATTDAHLTLAARLVQLFAGCILLVAVVDPAVPVHHDLTPMTEAEFRDGIGSGRLVPGQPGTTHAFAKMVLQGFLDDLATPAVQHALAVAATG